MTLRATVFRPLSGACPCGGHQIQGLTPLQGYVTARHARNAHLRTRHAPQQGDPYCIRLTSYDRSRDVSRSGDKQGL